MKFCKMLPTMEAMYASITELEESYVSLVKHLTHLGYRAAEPRISSRAGDMAGMGSNRHYQINIAGQVVGFTDVMPMDTPYNSVCGMIFKHDIPCISPPKAP